MSNIIQKPAFQKFDANTVIKITIGAYNEGTKQRMPIYAQMTLAELGYTVAGNPPPVFPQDKVSTAASPLDAKKLIDQYNTDFTKWANSQGGDPAQKLKATVLDWVYANNDVTPEDREGFVFGADSLTLQWLDAAGGYWMAAGAAHWGSN